MCVGPSIITFQLNCIMVDIVKTCRGFGGLGEKAEGFKKYKSIVIKKKKTWKRKISTSHHFVSVALFCGKFSSSKHTFQGKNPKRPGLSDRPGLPPPLSVASPALSELMAFGYSPDRDQSDWTHGLQSLEASSLAEPIFVSLRVVWTC